MNANPSKLTSYNTLLTWYVLFGALHEATHVTVAYWVGVPWNEGIIHDGLLPFLFRTAVGRQCVILNLNEVMLQENAMSLVRHAGWIASLLLVLLIPQRFQNANWAASLTAIEAITTDLLGWKALLPGPTTFTSLGATASLLSCGNFGIILLHHLWLTDQGQAALDVLQRMVKVTMLRGAQSGGVITFRPSTTSSSWSQNKARPKLKGIRSRVVNQKRTDLSVEVRKIVRREVFGSSRKFPQDFTPVLSGHTRFATSSKATLEGTHPHRWTPASARLVYDFSIPLENPGNEEAAFTPQTAKVENYITHNGDFDFYVVNGKTYDLEKIQKWLVITTGCPMPAVVDSCAVAGVVDLLRTQGCFGLSARYAVCLGLPTSKIEERIDNFPPYSYFERIGHVFEGVLGEMLKASPVVFDSMCNQQEIRQSFALRVLSKIEAQFETLVRPIERYIDAECGASLLAFCKVTIDAFFDNDLFMTTKTFLQNAKGSFGLVITTSLDAHRQICLAARGQTVSCTLRCRFLSPSRLLASYVYLLVCCLVVWP